MFLGVKYVVLENIKNIYRTYSIARYELLAEMRESRLGVFWNFANPVIQVLTFWFAFGYVFQRNTVDGFPFLVWMLAGMVVWFYINPCITDGCNSIYSKVDVITKMKFPVSILPLSLVFKKLFNHLCVLCVSVIVFAIYGYYPTVHWFGLIYYTLCATLFGFSISLVTSVLNMLARDTKKLITSCMRLLFYLTPILWEITRLPRLLRKIIMCNPIYYIVQGYRDCFLYHEGFGAYTWSAACFWIITIMLFLAGSFMIYKFKTKFIDMF